MRAFILAVLLTAVAVPALTKCYPCGGASWFAWLWFNGEPVGLTGCPFCNGSGRGPSIHECLQREAERNHKKRLSAREDLLGY